jgi:hypothetical protein
VSRSEQQRYDSATASLRSRPLLLPDDLIRPDRGHATVFAAYTHASLGTGNDAGRAEQAIFHAQLTPFFRRKDWRLDRVQPRPPVVVPRPSRSPQSGGEPAGAQEPQPDLARNVAEGMAQSLSKGRKA